MRIRSPLTFACALLALSAAVLPGCGGEETKLADAPPVTIPPSQKPEELPKSARPKQGSSASMNYNPAGTGALPPQ